MLVCMAETDRAREMRRLLRRREREGLTYAELAAVTGESRHTLAWWAWKLRQPVHEESGAPPFVELSISPPELATSTGIEVLLSNGRRLAVQRGFDEETLRRAIALLERTC